MSPGTFDSLPKKQRRKAIDQTLVGVTDADPMGLGGDWKMEKAESINLNQESIDDINLDSEPEFNPQMVDVVRTLSEFQNTIAYCKMNGIKEIQATPGILKYFLKQNYDPKAGVMIFQDVFVYEEGRMEEAKSKMERPMEEILFGHSKVELNKIIMRNSK